MNSESNNPTAPKEPEAKAAPRRLSLDPPLIPPVGRQIKLTNEQIYDLLDHLEGIERPTQVAQQAPSEPNTASTKL